mgnify:CR=1 FL=1
MSDVKKIATRESYGNALVELGKKHGDVVVLDADLANATKTGTFKKEFPERHIDCGIAESNMMGVAAGIATTGKVPFASSFAMFAAGRAFEQVRNSIGYPKLNVKIGATHAGISVGEDGATHQCNEDIALMRTIPGMVVINPSDDVEAKAAVEAAYEHQGPVYLRFGRLAVPVINDNPDYKFELGKAVTLREGTDVTIIATGLPVSESLAAAEKLAADGISAEVINIHTIKPLDEEAVIKAAAKTGKIVTVEEHSIIGGLGSAVCDVVAEKAPAKVMKIGINDTFGESGPALELIQKYGLDAQIVDVVVSGSRCRGIEQENSDLDVVVEYTGSTREDDLFNMLHEDSIYIAGIQVDINPITESRTGTLETYLPEVETYLQEKAQQEQINNQLVTQGREVVQEQNALVSEEKVLSELEKEPVIEPETVHITFTVAECGEFHNIIRNIRSR